MKRILISLLTAALLTGCTGVESQPMKIQSDPDTRPVAERMAARTSRRRRPAMPRSVSTMRIL